MFLKKGNEGSGSFLYDSDDDPGLVMRSIL